MQYLREQQYYIDLYDLHTIKQCIHQLKMLNDVDQRMRLEPTIKDYPDSEIERNIGLMRGRMLFVTKAHRYKERATRIAEWMETDRAKQEKQDNTPTPRVDCPNCDTAMVNDGDRTLRDWGDDQTMRILFTFNCPKCKKRQGVYDDGEIYVSKPNYCPKCGKEVKTAVKFKGEVTTFTTKCTNCKYKEVHVNDYAKSKAERETNEKRNAELLARYRHEFCLSEKEGNEYIELLEAMEVAHEIHDETLAEIDTPAQEKLMAVKKTPITDLESMLNKALSDSGFTRFSFGNPDIDRHVSVPFTVQDSNPKRHERESTIDLYDLLKEKLNNTNWRVPKDSLRYRLGFLSGKLSGYESEDDLLKLFGQEQPKNPKSKLDPKLREKHEHHSYVQLAKMSAEFEAKERIRKRRLKDEPEGFFFERGEHGYTCGICRRSQYSEDIWWREDGLRCRDCWRNIQEGIIPVLDLKKEWWEEDFFTSYEITYKRGIHSSSIKKLRREGELIGRDLKSVGGNTYGTIYLVSENQGFLKKYPRI